MRKVKSISTAVVTSSALYLTVFTALCEDSTIWSCVYYESFSNWRMLPTIPDTECTECDKPKDCGECHHE